MFEDKGTEEPTEAPEALVLLFHVGPQMLLSSGHWWKMKLLN